MLKAIKNNKKTIANLEKPKKQIKQTFKNHKKL